MRTVSFREGNRSSKCPTRKTCWSNKNHPQDLMARGIDAEHVDVVVNLNLPVEKVLVGLGLGRETKRPCFCRFLHRISSIICWFKCTPLLEGPTLWALNHWEELSCRVFRLRAWRFGNCCAGNNIPEKSICGKCRHWCLAKKTMQNAQYYKILKSQIYSRNLNQPQTSNCYRLPWNCQPSKPLKK